MLNFLFSKTPLFFMIQSFWRDEAFTYLIAKKNIFELFYLTAKDFNPPLYYLIVHYWMKIFGSSEISLRSISLIFYCLTIYFAYLIIIKFLKIKNQLFIFLFMILIITNPLLIYYAFEARTYEMFVFLSTASSYFFLKGQKKLFLLLTILNLYTHYFSFFIYLIQLIFFLFFKKRILIKKIKWVFIPFLFFLPWLFFVLITKDFKLLSDFWIKKMVIKDLFLIFSYLYFGFEKEFNFFKKEIGYFGYFFWFLILILLVKNYSINFKKKEGFYLLLLGVNLPIFIFILSFLKPIFLARYLIGFMFGFLLFLINNLNQINKKIAFLIIIILIFFNIQYNLIQVEKRKKADLRKPIKEIKSLVKESDYLYVIDVLDFHTALYYFGEERVFIYNQNYEEIPSYVGKVLMNRDNFKNSLPTYPQKAFVLYPDGYYDIQAAF